MSHFERHLTATIMRFFSSRAPPSLDDFTPSGRSLMTEGGAILFHYLEKPLPTLEGLHLLQLKRVLFTYGQTIHSLGHRAETGRGHRADAFGTATGRPHQVRGN